MAINYVQTNTQYLAGAGVIVGAVTVTFTGLTDIYGNSLTMADFGTKGYITFEPDTTNEEAATFTGLSYNANGSATLTGVSTILAKSPYTESSGLVRQHSGGTKVVITDNVGFWNTFANKNNNEVITGNWSGPNPVNSQDFATKAYVLSVVSGGAVTNQAIIVTGVAGATIAKGNLVYLNAATGQWNVCTSATASTLNNVIVGIAQGAGTSGNSIVGGVLLRGLDTTSFTGLTSNAVYYAGVAGAISTSAGATVLTLGESQSTSSILFDPRYTTTPTELEKAALAGLVTAGTNGTGAYVRQSLIKFGGTGSDGAFSSSSGVTTIDLGSAAVVTKNYTTFSLTGTASIAFTNPNANGTIIMFKVQGAATITSSTVPAIDTRLMGAAVGSAARSNYILSAPAGTAASGSTGGTAGTSFGNGIVTHNAKNLVLYAGGPSNAGSAGNNSTYDGSGGGGGTNLETTGSAGANSGGNTPGTGTPGTGVRGAGAFYMEVAGAFTCSSTINAGGSTGGAASGAAAGSGGGSAGGSLVIKYNALGSNTGTYTVAGGLGGAKTGFAGTGGTGADGYADVSLNTDLT